MPRSFKVRYIPCPVKSCTRQFTNQGGLKNHIRMHRTPQADPDLPAHQHPMNDNGVLGNNNVLFDQEPQNHAPNLEGLEKEQVTYHPLINGK